MNPLLLFIASLSFLFIYYFVIRKKIISHLENQNIFKINNVNEKNALLSEGNNRRNRLSSNIISNLTLENETTISKETNENNFENNILLLKNDDIASMIEDHKIKLSNELQSLEMSMIITELYRRELISEEEKNEIIDMMGNINTDNYDIIVKEINKSLEDNNNINFNNV